MSSDVAVVILAGGDSRRIGGGKPLRQMAGERLIDRALRSAQSWSTMTAISVRDRAQVGPVDAMIITDEPNIAGPLGGLISALRFGSESGCDFVLTIPADMPFLPPDLLQRLVSKIGDCGCALASSGGHLHPVCGLWRTCALDHVGTYLSGEKRSLRGFASLIGRREVEWSTAPFDPFFNINTPDDLAEAERRAPA
jgi:molybdopterin-guanine dinucleotide biosynthesis protein A